MRDLAHAQSLADNGEDGGNLDEPVLRCDSCNKIVTRKSLHKVGACKFCGNKRVKNVTVFNEVERDAMIVMGFQKFVDEFAEVDDE